MNHKDRLNDHDLDLTQPSIERKRIRLTFDVVVKMFFTLIMALTIIACGHYVWYRWMVECNEVGISDAKLVSCEYKRDTDRLFYEQERAAWELPIPEAVKAVAK